MRAAILTVAAVGASSKRVAPVVPTVQLKNAAVSGLTMPAVGLGTGGYNSNPAVGYGGYPECWAEIDPTGKVVGCGGFAARAVLEWIEVGGRRIDAANSYQNQHAVGQAMTLSQLSRDQFFLLSKVGPSNPLGFNDTLKQFEGIKSDMGVSYVDALLIHWCVRILGRELVQLHGLRPPHPCSRMLLFPRPRHGWSPLARGQLAHRKELCSPSMCWSFRPVDSSSQGNVSNPDVVSTDPVCNKTKTDTYNEKECRLDTWRALVQIFNAGGARSIGVLVIYVVLCVMSLFGDRGGSR